MRGRGVANGLDYTVGDEGMLLSAYQGLPEVFGYGGKRYTETMHYLISSRRSIFQVKSALTGPTPTLLEIASHVSRFRINLSSSSHTAQHCHQKGTQAREEEKKGEGGTERRRDRLKDRKKARQTARQTETELSRHQPQAAPAAQDGAGGSEEAHTQVIRARPHQHPVDPPLLSDGCFFPQATPYRRPRIASDRIHSTCALCCSLFATSQVATCRCLSARVQSSLRCRSPGVHF